VIELSLPGAHVRFTDRSAGDIRAAGPRDALAAVAGRPLARGRQVHGAVVRRVMGTEWETADEAADGQATARRDVAPTVLVADCLPVAIAGGGAVAMVHAGWRGLAAGVLEEGVQAVRRLGHGADLSAAVGPGAGPCCYHVGPDVHAAFGTAGPTVDLKAIARARLNAAGIDHVEDSGICTICDPRYFSFRRQGEAAGRQAGVAWLT
jgi:YfiH family protein